MHIYINLKVLLALLRSSVCIHTYIHTYIYAYINLMHTYIHVYIYIQYIHIYIHICIHTHICMYMYAYIHIYIHTYRCEGWRSSRCSPLECIWSLRTGHLKSADHCRDTPGYARTHRQNDRLL